MRHLFTNDYSSLCHPRILKALERCMDEQNTAYGLDKHSLHAGELIKKVFSSHQGEVHFIPGGTATNLLFISYALRPYEAVICVESGHINVHETAAIEGSGHKILTVKGKDGKLYPEDILSILKKHQDEYMVKPKLVYISNSTEIGTIYYKQELLDLYRICKEHDLYLFIDGARLGSALTSKDNDVPYDIFGKCSDAFYVGGAKNGLLTGEALVINNPNLQKDFRYHIKNRGAMLSKGFMVGIQFEEAFKDGLYFDIAKKINDTSDYLKDKFKELGLDMAYSPTNQIFVSFPKEVASKIIKEFGVELWEDKGDILTVRFVVSFTTTKEDVDDLINYLKDLIK